MRAPKTRQMQQALPSKGSQWTADITKVLSEQTIADAVAEPSYHTPTPRILSNNANATNEIHIALLEKRNEMHDVGRIELAVTVQGNDDPSPRAIKTGKQRRRLPRMVGQTDKLMPRISFMKLHQHLSRSVFRAVIYPQALPVPIRGR